MPGLAAIWNEGENNEGCDIQIFFNTKSNNLAMIMKSGTSTKDLNTKYEASDGFTGCIRNPSQLAVARIQGVNMVVGITLKPGTGEPKEWDISLVSPAYQPMYSVLAKYSELALSTKGDDGWIYFLSGADQGSIKLQEATLVSSGGLSPLDVQTPFPTTKLAAYYDTKADHRFVIYQMLTGNDSGPLFEYNIVTSQGGPIKSTDNARSSASIAVAYVDGVVALYYSAKDNKLRRVYKKDGVWGSSNDLKGESSQDKIDVDSQLTCAKVEKSVYIYWLASKSMNKFSRNIDKPFA